MYVVLFDRNFKALGTRKTYHASSWSLKRQTMAMDSFTATCQEIDGSAHSLFVGLFEDRGRLKYLALSGAPKTSGGVTTVNARDLRWVFRQELRLDYSEYSDDHHSPREWLDYLLNVPRRTFGDALGFDYWVDVEALPKTEFFGQDYPLPIYDCIGDLWQEIVRAMNYWGFIIKVVTTSSAASPVSSIGFVCVNAQKTYDVKLSDFDSPRVRNDNSAVNRAVCYEVVETLDVGGHPTGETRVNEERWYGIVNENGIEAVRHISLPRGEGIIPAQAIAIEGEDIEEVSAEACERLTDNLYNASVEISANAPLARYLAEAEEDLAIMGRIYGYNAADDSTYRMLPLSWKSEDSKGNVRLCFGRLDDYKYL